MKVDSSSHAASPLPAAAAAAAAAGAAASRRCGVRTVSESARFCMVHSMRPARTSLSDCRRGSKKDTCIGVQGRSGDMMEVNHTP